MFNLYGIDKNNLAKEEAKGDVKKISKKYAKNLSKNEKEKMRRYIKERTGENVDKLKALKPDKLVDKYVSEKIKDEIKKEPDKGYIEKARDKLSQDLKDANLSKFLREDKRLAGSKDGLLDKNKPIKDTFKDSESKMQKYLNKGQDKDTKDDTPLIVQYARKAHGDNTITQDDIDRVVGKIKEDNNAFKTHVKDVLAKDDSFKDFKNKKFEIDDVIKGLDKDKLKSQIDNIKDPSLKEAINDVIQKLEEKDNPKGDKSITLRETFNNTIDKLMEEDNKNVGIFTKTLQDTADKLMEEDNPTLKGIIDNTADKLTAGDKEEKEKMNLMYAYFLSTYDKDINNLDIDTMKKAINEFRDDLDKDKNISQENNEKGLNKEITENEHTTEQEGNTTPERGGNSFGLPEFEDKGNLAESVVAFLLKLFGIDPNVKKNKDILSQNQYGGKGILDFYLTMVPKERVKEMKKYILEQSGKGQSIEKVSKEDLDKLSKEEIIDKYIEAKARAMYGADIRRGVPSNEKLEIDDIRNGKYTKRGMNDIIKKYGKQQEKASDIDNKGELAIGKNPEADMHKEDIAVAGKSDGIVLVGGKDNEGEKISGNDINITEHKGKNAEQFAKKEEAELFIDNSRIPQDSPNPNIEYNNETSSKEASKGEVLKMPFQKANMEESKQIIKEIVDFEGEYKPLTSEEIRKIKEELPKIFGVDDYLKGKAKKPAVKDFTEDDTGRMIAKKYKFEKESTEKILDALDGNILMVSKVLQERLGKTNALLGERMSNEIYETLDKENDNYELKKYLRELSGNNDEKFNINMGKIRKYSEAAEKFEEVVERQISELQTKLSTKLVKEELVKEELEKNTIFADVLRKDSFTVEDIKDKYKNEEKSFNKHFKEVIGIDDDVNVNNAVRSAVEKLNAELYKERASIKLVDVESPKKILEYLKETKKKLGARLQEEKINVDIKEKGNTVKVEFSKAKDGKSSNETKNNLFDRLKSFVADSFARVENEVIKQKAEEVKTLKINKNAKGRVSSKISMKEQMNDKAIQAHEMAEGKGRNGQTRTSKNQPEIG